MLTHRFAQRITHAIALPLPPSPVQSVLDDDAYWYFQLFCW
jgi:hypothetical protein